jgi:hypothetical protein
MLRYRTEGISTVDMTYLFLGIALGLIMAISDAGWLQLSLIGAIVLGFTQVLEGGLLTRRELRQEVLYDRIDLVNANERAEMIRDLRARTGLNVHRIEIEEIDLLRDAARIVVFYPAADELATDHETAAAEIRPSVRPRYRRPVADQR